VLLAGGVGPDLAPVLDGPDARRLRSAGRLKERLGFQTLVDEGRLFAAADAVWMGYRGHYTMSGVLVQAAAMGLPVISCAEGLIGWWTRKYAAGEVVDPDDAPAVVNAIGRLSSDRAWRERYRANARDMARLHGPEAFASSICDAVGENSPCRSLVAAGMAAE
jgi:glycosyltransferase involved in cell wall biosynthesis